MAKDQPRRFEGAQGAQSVGKAAGSESLLTRKAYAPRESFVEAASIESADARLDEDHVRVLEHILERDTRCCRRAPTRFRSEASSDCLKLCRVSPVKEELEWRTAVGSSRPFMQSLSELDCGYSAAAEHGDTHVRPPCGSSSSH